MTNVMEIEETTPTTAEGWWGWLRKKCGQNKSIVAVVPLTGIIRDGAGNRKMGGGLCITSLEKQLEAAFSLPKKRLKAVALLINSPGGSPTQSELIYKRIRMLAEEKQLPVLAFVEDAAASGGYWLACAADEIIAAETSLVGSIGVVSSLFGFVGAMEKVGVERRIYTQGENKAILDPFQPEKPEDVKILLALQKELHETFKQLVRTRRGSKIAHSDEKQLFSGEFWTGKRAMELGLVDKTGDIYSDLQARYGKDVKLLRVERPQGWLSKKFGIEANSMAENIVHTVIEKAREQTLWARLGQ